MKIEKNGRIFSVTETETNWKLSEEKGRTMSVTYNIPKENAPTAEELRDYVLSSELF